jgi:hypothetical protein
MSIIQTPSFRQTARTSPMIIVIEIVLRNTSTGSGKKDSQEKPVR